MCGIQRWSVNSPDKWPVTRKMFPFNDVFIILQQPLINSCPLLHITYWPPLIMWLPQLIIWLLPLIISWPLLNIWWPQLDTLHHQSTYRDHHSCTDQNNHNPSKVLHLLHIYKYKWRPRAIKWRDDKLPLQDNKRWPRDNNSRPRCNK